jgi:hypothetical protein
MATTVLAVAWPATVSIANDGLLREPHTMQLAADWIVRNVESDRSVSRLWAEYPLLDPTRHRLELLRDGFEFQAAPYRPLSADVVVLDDLPLHPWRRELLADLRASYVEAARFTARPAAFGRALPEPFLPPDSRYTRSDVTIYRRTRPGGS